MKSRSMDFKQTSLDKGRYKKIDDFIGLYKKAEETPKSAENSVNNGNSQKERKLKPDTPKREVNKMKKKKNEAVSISHINIEMPSINSSFGGNTPLNESKVTSTPISSNKGKEQEVKLKSIVKNKSLEYEYSDGSVKKSKKRNKSVSFLLDDNEGVAVKKVKSEDILDKSENKFNKNAKKGFKQLKKTQNTEKENKSDVNKKELEIKSRVKKGKHTPQNEENVKDEIVSTKQEKKRHLQKPKKVKNNTISIDEAPSSTEVNNPSNSESVINKTPDPKDSALKDNNKVTAETKPKKLKKKKSHEKNQADDAEPAMKTRKTAIKPEIIAEDLENLSIGDNAHTLTNLLDEMTVVDKNKRKKAKPKQKVKKEATVTENTETVPLEGEKEKVKWKKRKWNKDKKGDVDTEGQATSVIVENLPISIMLTYKKILTEHFEKCGLIKRIGVAEVYPTEESKPVFTTTIYFYSDGAATQALEENNAIVEGSRIKVKRPLPPTQTTVVLRSYAELTEQSITSLFTGAGKIRNIRHLVKGKKAMSTAFVEFDGPETVERAIQKTENAKIGGKKVHVAKFEIRTVKKLDNKETKELDE